MRTSSLWIVTRWRRGSRRRSRPRRGRTGRRGRSRRSGTGTRAADLVAAGRGVVDVAALVGDVAEQVALGVLRPRRAEVRADAPVDRRRAFLAVAVDRHAADEHDAAPVDELVRRAGRARRRASGSGKRSRVMSSTSSVTRLGVHERGVELGDVRVGELEHVAVAEVVAPPLAVGLERFERRHVDRGHRDRSCGGCGLRRRGRGGRAARPVASPCS